MPIIADSQAACKNSNSLSKRNLICAVDPDRAVGVFYTPYAMPINCKSAIPRSPKDDSGCLLQVLSMSLSPYGGLTINLDPHFSVLTFSFNLLGRVLLHFPLRESELEA
jgi:hypothetical protein